MKFVKKCFEDIYLSSLCIAFLAWGILNVSGVQHLFFSNGVNGNMILGKALHLVFLFFLVLVIQFMIRRRREPKVMHWMIVSVAFALIYMAILLCIWPGMWSWDDVAILNNAQTYNLTPWQHFLSGLWHIICLQTLPFSTGVIIVQIMVGALIAGYCVAYVADAIIGEKRRWLWLVELLLFLPMISAPVVMYLNTGYRMGIYSFLELLLIVKLFLLYKKTSVEEGTVAAITILTVLVAAWRTEAIYYPIAVLLCMLTMGKGKVKWQKALVLMVVVQVVVCGIGKWNDKLIGTNNYSVSATVLPVGELLKVTDHEADAADIQAIHKVFDVSVVYLNPEWQGEAYLWNAIQYGYTQEDLKGYYKGYVHLALKYPKTVWKATWNMFLATAGMSTYETGYPTIRTACLNTDNSTLWLTRGAEWEAWIGNHSKWNGVINEQLREKVIRIISCIDEEGHANVWFRLIWNLWIPLALSTASIIVLAIRRRWREIPLFLCVLARVPIIFLTACAPYFMYYLSVYLVGYFLSVFVLCDTVISVRRKHE